MCLALWHISGKRCPTSWCRCGRRACRRAVFIFHSHPAPPGGKPPNLTLFRVWGSALNSHRREKQHPNAVSWNGPQRRAPSSLDLSLKPLITGREFRPSKSFLQPPVAFQSVLTGRNSCPVIKGLELMPSQQRFQNAVLKRNSRPVIKGFKLTPSQRRFQNVLLGRNSRPVIKGLELLLL